MLPFAHKMHPDVIRGEEQPAAGTKAIIWLPLTMHVGHCCCARPAATRFRP